MRQAMGGGGIAVCVPLKRHSPRTIKHAALALTATAFVRLEPSKDRVRVGLKPKSPSGNGELKRLAAQFREELRLSEIRGAIEENNRRLREHIVGLALRGEPQACATEAEEGLTEEQQKELDRLIAEVEAEIKNETGKTAADPLGVTRTWEERFGRGRADDKG